MCGIVFLGELNCLICIVLNVHVMSNFQNKTFIRIEVHLSVRLPFGQYIKIMLKNLGVKVVDDFSINDTVVSE